LRIVEIVPAATPAEAAAIEATLKRIDGRLKSSAPDAAHQWSGRIYSTADGDATKTWREAARREAVDAGV
jgi:hypothetical protein